MSDAERAYLDTAAEGLLPERSRAAVNRYLEGKSQGSTARPDFYDIEVRATAAAAKLMGTTPAHIAFLSSATEALSLLANSIDWRDGDEVVISDLEFPSNVLPWLRLASRGVKTIVLPSSGGKVTLADFEAALNARTRLVSVSYVSYMTGASVPYLPDLAQAAHRTGALLAVDATQGLGRVPIPLDGVDYLVASSYKWLLGTHGLGVVYLGDEMLERFTPASAGWYSVPTIFTPDRFERFEYKAGANRLQGGFPNFPALYAIESSLNLLIEKCPACIEKELRPMISEVRRAVEATGYEALTPGDPAYASGIFSFACEDPVSVGEALRQQGVVVWAGDRRVRVSIHYYNDEGDIRRFVDALSRLPKC